MGDPVFLQNQQHHTDKLNFKLACRPLLFVLLLVKPSPYVPFTFPLQWFLILQILRISLLNSLPPSILLLGDFNAHITLWVDSKTDLRGKMIVDLLLKLNLSILNDGSYTYLHPATGSLSAIDLSIASPSLYLDFSGGCYWPTWQWPLPYLYPLLYYCTSSYKWHLETI